MRCGRCLADLLRAALGFGAARRDPRRARGGRGSRSQTPVGTAVLSLSTGDTWLRSKLTPHFKKNDDKKYKCLDYMI